MKIRTRHPIPTGDYILEMIGLEDPKFIEKESFYRRDQYYSIINWLSIYPESSELPTSYHGQVEGIRQAYFLLINLGETEKAQKILQLPMKESDEDLFEQLGIWGYNRMRLEMAEAFYQEALPLEQKAFGLKLLGTAYRNLNDFDRAEYYFKESLTIYDKLEDAMTVQFLLHTLGLLMMDKGNHEGAKEYFLEAIDLAQKLNHEVGLASCYNDLARVYSHFGDFEQSKSYYVKALTLHQKYYHILKDSTAEAWIIHNYSRVLYEVGEFDLALDYAERSYQMFLKLGFKNGQAWSLYGMGMIWLGLKQYLKCRTALEKSKVLFLELEAISGLHHILLVQGELALAEKKIKIAADTYTKILRTNLSTKKYSALHEAFAGFGHIAYLMDDYEKSTMLFSVSELYRMEGGKGVIPVKQAIWETLVKQNNINLGEVQFRRFWQKGKRLSLEQAIITALSLW